MNHYRVTRPLAYVGTPGANNPGSRQGYYENAENPEEAAKAVKERIGVFDTAFDVQDWTEKHNDAFIRINVP